MLTARELLLICSMIAEASITASRQQNLRVYSWVNVLLLDMVRLRHNDLRKADNGDLTHLKMAPCSVP